MQPVSFYCSMVEGLQAINVLYLDLFRDLDLFFASNVQVCVVNPSVFIEGVKSNFIEGVKSSRLVDQAHPVDFFDRNVKQVWISIHNGSLPGIEDAQGGV